MPILDSTGLPMAPARRSADPRRMRPSASLDGSAPQFFPYDAAQWFSPEMGDWLPWIRSPDTEINFYRDRMVARARDLVRNDGWAAGAITRILDSTVGGSYRLAAQPDYRALSLYSPAFDAAWASEFRRATEALWRTFADDLGHWNDLGRQLTVTQQLRQALRHELVDGESLTVAYWLPDRVGYGAARYATAYQVIDPDRLSNPYQQMDTRFLRGGVEIDEDGAPLAYHIRKAHQNDWYNSVEAMEWERVEREDEDGWRRVTHSYDQDRAGQNRGVSVFAPVVSRLKMLARYYGVELQAAAINAVFGTYITSPFDQEMIEDALSDGSERMGLYQALRVAHHDQHKIMLGGARVPTLAPGEDIKAVSAERPMGEFSQFTHEMLRGVASVLGVSAEQVTQDYSETNYSSARAAIVESEKTFRRRMANFNTNVAGPIYAGWLHEAWDRGELPRPRNAPDFVEMRTAIARCRWLGAGRGWVDPVAERQGEVLGMDAGFNTLESVCAEIEGMDWEEVLDQRAVEIAAFKDRGIPVPTWAGMQGANSPMQANQVAQKPQTAQPA